MYRVIPAHPGCIINIASVYVIQFRDTLKVLGVTIDSVLTMDRHVTEVTTTDGQLRYIRSLFAFDAVTLVGHSIVVVTGLRQRTAVRHICSQHPPCAGCTELTDQSNLPSSTLSQCNRITSAASLASSSPAHQLQSTNWQLSPTRP